MSAASNGAAPTQQPTATTLALSATQAGALRDLASGIARTVPTRTLTSLIRRGLVVDRDGIVEVTPLGLEASMRNARLCGMNPPPLPMPPRRDEPLSAPSVGPDLATTLLDLLTRKQDRTIALLEAIVNELGVEP